MPNFMIRVELHGATSQSYATLADGLRAVGITDVISADDGSRYKLPPAEYTYSGNTNKAQVWELVNAKAAATGTRYAIVVCEGFMTWSGLPKV